jgi:uncharacterized protein (DUF2236 family)
MNGTTEPERVTYAEVLRYAADDSPASRAIVDRYLNDMARDFSLMEVFAVIALVDTPDVFD